MKAAKKTSWSISARTLPGPTGASEVLRKAIMSGPVPDAEAVGCQNYIPYLAEGVHQSASAQGDYQSWNAPTRRHPAPSGARKRLNELRMRAVRRTSRP